MFDKVLIANRGEIACRIIRTLDKLGVQSVAIYSEADAYAQHVQMATEAHCIGPAAVSESYLQQDKLLEVAKNTGAQAIHPGYGLLSENPEFAEKCEAAGLVFLGPTGDQMRKFGLKHTARELAEAAQVPLLPGTGLLKDAENAAEEATKVGYPVMLKSTAGGGGIGMQICNSEDELLKAWDTVEGLSKKNFSDGGIFLEKYVARARHIEVQVFGDGKGNVLTLGERCCTIQRRNQKVIEETPAPNLPDSTRASLNEVSEKLASSVNYRSAGTVEFVLDATTGDFYFLEMNTRLQVEHGVTEEIFGVDLVEWMIKLGSNDLPALETLKTEPKGHAIQLRLYAEDPAKNFQPDTGVLSHVKFPGSIRVDTWVTTGDEVTPYYDPLLAKLIAYKPSRTEAIATLRDAIESTELWGLTHNLDYLYSILEYAPFIEVSHTTKSLNDFDYSPATISVLSPGTQTTIQDYPGRVGYWDIGVPPSGPMDALSFRLGNSILGNPADAAGLEITVTGPTLRFNVDTVFCLTGAEMIATLDGESVDFTKAIQAKTGQTLKIGKIKEAGSRAYLQVAGGFNVPDYLGSKSTFTLGQFGGHCGRTLLLGDTLKIFKSSRIEDLKTGSIAAGIFPEISKHWTIHVLYGPHGAPDFFTGEDIETFFDAEWEVHFNSARTGVRLVGPKPEWARPDGGEAGLHPSNIHDNAYAIGAVDFTGDMPVILGPDGPSLGGFVCPVTLIEADMWKLGQLTPGDKVEFVRVSQHEATAMEQQMEQQIATLQPSKLPEIAPSRYRGAVLCEDVFEESPRAVYRRAGDKYLLVEYGPLELDLNLRFRAHALMETIQNNPIDGILELTPGIRSLQVHYESKKLSMDKLVDYLRDIEKSLPAITDMVVPSRIVHLPLSWDDEATQLAIEKYDQVVRKNAPWCPSNLEFIRRINGLNSINDVRDIFFNASYMVMGLGDVYLGAPVATPVDPRHRMVTTKYNPARTWTPENAVGIGGAYLCIYGMEGPGGYQFVGRTIQVWNRYKQTKAFTDGKPWLLRFFDQLRFYPVSSEELLQARKDFIHGRFDIKIEEESFNLADYNSFLVKNRDSISQFKQKQQQAFDDERARWKETGQDKFEIDEASLSAGADDDIPEGCIALKSHVPGNVWKIQVQPGAILDEGDTVVIMESMKMEINIEVTEKCELVELRCKEASPVSNGQTIAILKPIS